MRWRDRRQRGPRLHPLFCTIVVQLGARALGARGAVACGCEDTANIGRLIQYVAPKKGAADVVKMPAAAVGGRER
jgi:hypothetical protein